MDPNKEEIENIEFPADDETADDNMSVDDFIRELEAKEKDLHITADTTVIELADAFEDGRLPEIPVQVQPVAEQQAEADKAAERAAEAQAGLKTRIVELEAESAELLARISKMEEDRSEIFKNSQRRAKDFENYKARTERERTLTMQNQAGDLASKMLPALDNLIRALDFAEKELAGRSPEFKQFYDGIYMVNEQILSTFAEMGVHSIPAIGEIFDPNKHEAVAVEETDEFPENTICEEMVRGFEIGGQVIRHSLVKVAKPSSDQAAQTYMPTTVDSNSDNGANNADALEIAVDDEIFANVPEPPASEIKIEQGNDLNGFELETFGADEILPDDNGETGLEPQISRFE